MKETARGAMDLAHGDVADTYNAFKEFEGRKYTGMKIGRSHKWNYDPGVWKETKVTPEAAPPHPDPAAGLHDLEKEAVADTKPPVRAKGAEPALRAVRARKGTKTKHSRAA